MAKACWQQIEAMFCKLDEFMAFELLRNGRDRADYLLVKEAKIIAMTCTHAALRRKELVDLGFRYDNILMEEAAQILEVETFIPLLLQVSERKRFFALLFTHPQHTFLSLLYFIKDSRE